jgi:type II restriction/modification system DNA methylase subunit YeeA
MEDARARRPATMAEARKVHQAARRTEEQAFRQARRLADGFLERLRTFRVLDPACGSGNFLYLALQTLKDLELRVAIELEALGLDRPAPAVGPEQLLGIEINPYAAELARVSVWIGEIQWMRWHGFAVARNPILRKLDHIQCRDALLNEDGSEAEWPEAEAIVGNPPYLGAKLMKGRLGVKETEQIRAAFVGRLPGFTDLVCYWFEKARAHIKNGLAKQAGLVATSSIAKNTNLPVLKRIHDELFIYDALSDESWIIDGATVRVALICFCSRDMIPPLIRLNNRQVVSINANLTTGVDVTHAASLRARPGGW